MKVKHVLLLFVAISITSTMAAAPELEVLQGNNQFTTNLYQVLAKEEGNIVFSPISAHAVLAMAYQGSEASTAEKLSNTLKLSNPSAAAEGYQHVISRLNNVSDVSLWLANKIYVHEKATLKDDFKNAITKNFFSEVQKLKFSDSGPAAKTINDWVLEKTQQKIKDLISPSDLNDLTRLVLVNAVYFKGDWANKFDPAKTKTEPFYLNEKDTVDVQMMHIKRNFNYGTNDELKAKILEMPYKNKDISMVIILPNEKNGIKELEQKLATTDLSAVLKNLYSFEVNVALPKFKIEKAIDLKTPLKELGLGEIFSPDKANFKGMIELRPDDNLYVSKVVQKAFIEVNEEGAEAAAATGVLIALAPTSYVEPIPEQYFVADRPFIYLLIDQAVNPNIVFMGRISKP